MSGERLTHSVRVRMTAAEHERYQLIINMSRRETPLRAAQALALWESLRELIINGDRT